MNRLKRAIPCLFTALSLSGCLSLRTVSSPHAKNHGGRVELAEAQGARPQPSANELLVRYLRAGGVYFEWQGRALMTLPFASNYPLFGDLEQPVGGHTGPRPDLVLHEAIYAQRLEPDERAIAHVLSGLEPGRVDLLLAGHSHYDHLGDVRPIAERWAKSARLYVNDTGKNMLAGTPALRERSESYQGETGFLPRDYQAKGQLIRFRAIPSEHAPNLEVLGQTFAWPLGEVTSAWTTPFESHRLFELRAGKTHAFLIDFLDPQNPRRVAFRVHYQDAASSPFVGYPPAHWLDERAVDLAVLALPGRETLPPSELRYPVGLLRYTHARHVLVIHYEDFFRPVLRADGQSAGVRLIPTLAGPPQRDFLDAVVGAVAEPAPGPCRVPDKVEGLCADAFTLPLPGEWLLFDTASSAPARGSDSGRAVR